MNTRITNCFLVMAIFIFAASCDRPECVNVNPAFDKFTPDMQAYKTELAKQIKSIGPENLAYWFDKYLKKGEKEFIVINIQGKQLCAVGEVQVTDWTKLSGMRRETSGYRRAELRGLKIRIEQDATGIHFLYDNIDRIID